MAKKISIFFVLFILVILQVSFLPNFFDSRIIPDPALIVLIFFTTRKGFGEIWLKAVTAGLILDFFSFYPLGVNVIALLLAVLVTGFLTRRFSSAHSFWKLFILILLIIIGTLINDFTVAILIKLFKNSYDFLSIFSWDIGLKMLNNTIVFVIIYWPLKKYENMKLFFEQKDILKK